MKLNKKEIEAILEGGIDKFKEVVQEKKPEYFEPKKKKGWYIRYNSDIEYSLGEINKEDRNLYPTKKDAEMALAMCELIYLRDEANGQPMDDWCDWGDCSDDKMKYCIVRYENTIYPDESRECFEILAFQTKEIRDKFLKDNEPLIKKAFGL